MGLIEKENSPPKPHNKRVWASVEKPSIEVIQDMFMEALRRDPQQHRKWVVLIDGQVAQLKMIKKVVNEGINMDFQSALAYEMRCFELLFATEDQKEGMRAFIEKRKPAFKGR